MLLDREWKASSAPGADRTIGSPVVGGGPAVLELHGARELATAR